MKNAFLIFGILLLLQPVNGQEVITDFLYQPGDRSSYPSNFIELNQNIFYTARTESTGNEIWVTDGFENESYLLKDINPGIENSVPSQLVALNDLIYFQAFDNEHGAELWKTDGTESGTVLVADVIPGQIGSSPFKITYVNNDVFFIAETIERGQQIWKIPFNTISDVPEVFDTTEISVYPNPSVDVVHFNTDLSIDKVSIYNLNRQLIGVEKPAQNSIDVSSLSSGFYVLQFAVNGKKLSKKFVKK